MLRGFQAVTSLHAAPGFCEEMLCHMIKNTTERRRTTAEIVSGRQHLDCSASIRMLKQNR
jgi:hypothetical protein